MMITRYQRLFNTRNLNKGNSRKFSKRKFFSSNQHKSLQPRPNSTWWQSLSETVRLTYDNLYTPKNFALKDSGPFGITVYRSDDREYPQLSLSGFQPRGSNRNLWKYVTQNAPSIFVPTAKTEQAAYNFGVTRQSTTSNPRGFWIYEITRLKTSIDVEDFLYFSNPFPSQQEIAALGTIPPRNIKRRRYVDENGKLGPWMDCWGYEDVDPGTGEGMGP